MNNRFIFGVALASFGAGMTITAQLISIFVIEEVPKPIPVIASCIVKEVTKTNETTY